jgi:uncharacterized protein
MKINLSEIPEDGRLYDFNRTTGELNLDLEDLIGQSPYSVEMFIRPIGNAYELRGFIRTEMPALCSKCGWDLNLPIEKKFNEILLKEEAAPRNSHSVHGNHSIDFLSEGPSVTPYTGQVFYISDFVHEALALAEPFYPSCGDGNCTHLQDVLNKQAELARSFAEADSKESHPAFAVLKNLKLDSN